METIRKSKIYGVEDYESLIGPVAVDRIRKKARLLQDVHVANVNSTYYGGGVAEILLSMTLLMNKAGIRTGWRNIYGHPDFFNVTKMMHNALQSAPIDLDETKKKIYEETIYENSLRTHLDTHDFIVIHDPQPLPLINYYKKKGLWIWRCHIDISNPNAELWKYLSSFIEKYDSVIVSIPEYKQKLKTPQNFFMPAIDPFSMKNQLLDKAQLKRRLEHYKIPTDLPIISQISRFDRWKDPEGVIRAFDIARKEVDCTLVLLGNIATDDPEGQEVFESILRHREDRVVILSREDTVLVNALQRLSAVILQKSIREGFGLTVTEAMWKGTPVIGGRAGGIPHQIQDGVNGFLVSSPEEAAERIVRLLKDQNLRARMGENARRTVTEKFLMSRLLEQYLDLFIKLRQKKR